MNNKFKITLISLLAVVSLAACKEKIPPVDNLNSQKEIIAVGRSGVLLSEGKELPIQEFYDKYCLGVEGEPTCNKVNASLRISRLHTKSVTGQD